MMVRRKAPDPSSKMALLAHADLQVLSSLQNELTAAGWRCIVARDLPSVLLAITQHYFDLAIIGSRVREEGDGWPVAAVLRMIFPASFLAVIVPHTDVLTIKSAINSGINEVYEAGRSAREICAGALAQLRGNAPVGTSIVH